jgi:hypothetical protein
MNPVIFYYSNEGSTAKVAEGLAKATSGELRRLNVAGKVGSGAIFAAMLGLSSRLVDTNLDTTGVDAVVLMTPIWAGAPVPASNSFIRQAALKGKRVYFVTVSGEGTSPRAVTTLERRLKSSGAVVIGHREVLGKAPAAFKKAAKPGVPVKQYPTDEALTAAGVALAADLTAALAAAGAAR